MYFFTLLPYETPYYKSSVWYGGYSTTEVFIYHFSKLVLYLQDRISNMG